ncbi:hypothetical protein [Streptomyces fagopyri]
MPDAFREELVRLKELEELEETPEAFFRVLPDDLLDDQGIPG